ncbi:MAG: hypothetical protein ACSLFP_09590 [Acidimicrobiales bacterium]
MRPPTPGTSEHLAAIDALWAQRHLPGAASGNSSGRRGERARAAVAAGLHRATAPRVLRVALVLALSVGVAGVTAAATSVRFPVPVSDLATAAATGIDIEVSTYSPLRRHEVPVVELSDDRPAAPVAVPRSPQVAATSEVPVAAPAAAPPRATPVLPTGKGMWIWKPELTEGGDAAAIVAKAQQIGLTHLYVRTGSSVQGFHGAEFLDRILPVAHAAGIAVYGWDFPYFRDIGADIDRSLTAIRYRTPDGHGIDGFVPDIETQSEGTNLSADNARSFSEGLRAAVGPDYTLLVAVPRPSSAMVGGRYPYDAVVGPYDAIIPMVYWLNRQPDTDVTGAIEWLSRYGKPIIPVGQAYDGAPEGGRPGPPPADEIRRFLAAAAEGGATGVSFWSWQHASDEIWSTYAAATEFARR